MQNLYLPRNCKILRANSDKLDSDAVNTAVADSSRFVKTTHFFSQRRFTATAPKLVKPKSNTLEKLGLSKVLNTTGKQVNVCGKIRDFSTERILMTSLKHNSLQKSREMVVCRGLFQCKSCGGLFLFEKHLTSGFAKRFFSLWNWPENELIYDNEPEGWNTSFCKRLHKSEYDSKFNV